MKRVYKEEKIQKRGTKLREHNNRKAKKLYSEMSPQNHVPSKDTNNRLLVRYIIAIRKNKRISKTIGRHDDPSS